MNVATTCESSSSYHIIAIESAAATTTTSNNNNNIPTRLMTINIRQFPTRPAGYYRRNPPTMMPHKATTSTSTAAAAAAAADAAVATTEAVGTTKSSIPADDDVAAAVAVLPTTLLKVVKDQVQRLCVSAESQSPQMPPPLFGRASAMLTSAMYDSARLVMNRIVERQCHHNNYHHQQHQHQHCCGSSRRREQQLAIAIFTDTYPQQWLVPDNDNECPQSCDHEECHQPHWAPVPPPRSDQPQMTMPEHIEIAMLACADMLMENAFRSIGGNSTPPPPPVSETTADEYATAIGRHVAQQYLQWRNEDGAMQAADRADTDFDYVAASQTAGQWIPTLPEGLAAQLPYWPQHQDGNWLISQYDEQQALATMVQPPSTLDTVNTADSLLQVELLGRDSSTARTAQQTAMAQLWANASAAIQMTRLATELLEVTAQTAFQAQQQADMAAANPDCYRPFVATPQLLMTLQMHWVRRMARFAMIIADSMSMVWRLKYQHLLARPTTLIRRQQQQQQQQQQWLPLVRAPAHPAWPCADAVAAELAALELRNEWMLSDQQPQLQQIPLSGGATYTVQSLSLLASQVGQSRIYGGVQFQDSVLTSRDLARQLHAQLLQQVDADAATLQIE